MTALSLIALPGLVIGLVACAPAPTESKDVDRVQTSAPSQKASGPFSPLSAPTGLDPAAVALGRSLFHDTRLSEDGSISCASCHDLARGGVDGLPRSVGVKGGVGTINSPTVLNSGLGFVQFWDGRAATLEEQVDGPVTNPLEMGSSWPAVVDRISADADYRAAFGQTYDGTISADTIASAIASFERSLVTVDAPFDRHLRGEPDALSDDALQGLELFTSYGCVACHQGAGLGGNMYQIFGVMGDYFADRGNVTEADLGRFNVTGAEGDRHVFKVPSLRNVALTAPYFHDASATTLEAAVTVMGRYQLGRDIPPEDNAAIVAFLESLTGRLPETGS